MIDFIYNITGASAWSHDQRFPLHLQEAPFQNRRCGDVTMEEWKDIPGYEGLYSVSINGFVKSLPKIDMAGKKRKEKLLRSFESHDDYQRIRLYKDGSHKTYQLHRLVMMSFVGKSKLEVDHIDGDKLNNKLDNLQYISRVENVRKYHRGNDRHSSKYLGVSYCNLKKRWIVNSVKELGNKYIGSFKTELEAKMASELFHKGITV